MTQSERFDPQGKFIRRYLPQLANLPAEQRFEMKVVSSVLPFRVNQYVIDELIDWSNIPADPMFQLTFPQRGMLAPEHFERIATLLREGADKVELEQAVSEVRMELNPHPADQMEMNMPRDEEGARLDGIQHKYRETVLFFPARGRPVTATAPSVSAGRSSWVTRSCASHPQKLARCTSICAATPMSPMCCSPVATPW